LIEQKVALKVIKTMEEVIKSGDGRVIVIIRNHKPKKIVRELEDDLD